MIPDAFMDLLNDDVKAFAFLATIKKDGTPQVTPVWFRWDGQHIVVNTAVGRLKDRNMKRNPHVALAIADPANPGRYLQIQGKVVDRDLESADADIDFLSKKYTGNPVYQWRSGGEVRVTYRIQPERIDPHR